MIRKEKAMNITVEEKLELAIKNLTYVNSQIDELEEQNKKLIAYLYAFETVGCWACHREITAKSCRELLGIEIR